MVVSSANDPMKSVLPPASDHAARLTALKSAIDRVAIASMVIDPDAAAIVAANANALALFEFLPNTELPITLDSAMPALADIRRVMNCADDDSMSNSSVPMIFWMNGQTTKRMCTVSSLVHPHEAGATRPSRLMLLQIDNGQEATHRNGIAEDGPDLYPASHAALETAAIDPRVPRSDAETLKEIARRIREGVLPPAQRAAGEIATGTVQSPSMIEQRADERPDESAMTQQIDTPDLARLAHELKTPLTAIAAAAEIMRDERLGEMGNQRYLGYAADVHDSAQHALSVIAKMLGRDAARVSDDNATSVIDLNALVARTVSTLQPLASERRVTLAFDAQDASPMVTASPTALRQILINLVTNALKFTPSGGDVRVVTGYLDSGATFLVVRDTGIGIDDETARLAISRDGQTSTARLSVRPGGGFGIGLPLVARLVRDIGGDIEIDSAPGKGTVVLVSFVA